MTELGVVYISSIVLDLERPSTTIGKISGNLPIPQVLPTILRQYFNTRLISESVWLQRGVV